MTRLLAITCVLLAGCTTPRCPEVETGRGVYPLTPLEERIIRDVRKFRAETAAKAGRRAKVRRDRVSPAFGSDRTFPASPKMLAEDTARNCPPTARIRVETTAGQTLWESFPVVHPFAEFAQCMADYTDGPRCGCWDLDEDGDVDLFDFYLYQQKASLP